MKYTVWFADWDKLRNLPDNRETLCSVVDGVKVSPEFEQTSYEVEATDLENLFDLLNHGHLQHRSFSTGDVAVDEAGNAHLCKACGWKKLNNTPSKPDHFDNTSVD